MHLTQLAARYQKRAVDLSYSTELAVAEMCQSVQKQLDRITELSGIEGPEKIECAVYFQGLITEALTRIRSLSEKHNTFSGSTSGASHKAVCFVGGRQCGAGTAGKQRYFRKNRHAD